MLYVYTNLSDQLYRIHYRRSRISFSSPLAGFGNIRIVHKACFEMRLQTYLIEDRLEQRWEQCPLGACHGGLGHGLAVLQATKMSIAELSGIESQAGAQQASRG